jgi:hypothetical protein
MLDQHNLEKQVMFKFCSAELDGYCVSFYRSDIMDCNGQSCQQRCVAGIPVYKDKGTKFLAHMLDLEDYGVTKKWVTITEI